jgi:hypothetical protein
VRTINRRKQMRCIIIEDKDAKDLLRRLKLELLRETHPNAPVLTGHSAGDMHRIFHYQVVQWLQEQGAELT